MHSVPDYEHLLTIVDDVDAIEVYNPRVAIGSFNEEAARFAAKYRIVAGAGSDAHVAQGLGSVRIRMRDFDGPRSSSSRCATAEIITKPSSLLYVQALKFLQTNATPPAARRAAASAACGARRASPDARARTTRRAVKPQGPMPATDDEIREKYLERAIRELNHLTRDLQSCRHCPRGNLMPVLGSGHPQADVFLLKYAPQASEVEEGVAFYGRSGTALMKSLKRLGIDPLAVYGTLCVKCPVADPGWPTRRAWPAWSRSWRSCQPKIVVVMGEDALDALNDLGVPLARPLEPEPGVVQRFTPSIDALVVPTSTRRSTRRPPSGPSGPPSACSATGTPSCRRTEGVLAGHGPRGAHARARGRPLRGVRR